MELTSMVVLSQGPGDFLVVRVHNGMAHGSTESTVRLSHS
jgi:hypothetical protein